MKKRGRGQPAQGERGTQVAELAMVLPFLLFLGLAVTEGAGFVRAHQVINNAAREGVKFSSVYFDNGSNNAIAGVKGVAVDYAANNGVTLVPADVTVNQCATITTASGDNRRASQVDVVLAYQLRYLPRLPWFSLPGTVNLRGRSEFVNFYGC
jgi:Flp pilus assembly protein TadG